MVYLIELVKLFGASLIARRSGNASNNTHDLSFLLIVYYKASIRETHQRKAASYFPTGKPMPLVLDIAIFVPDKKNHNYQMLKINQKSPGQDFD
ncbi:MAG: hypothetical protein ACJA2Q_002925 [Pseudohongiellaceae bacterium]